MKQAAIVTKESLHQMLIQAEPAKRAQIIGRALVVLLNRQTNAEQQANVTETHNNIGFTGADARSGSLTAKSFLKNGTLQEWQIEQWMRVGKSGFPRLCKYHGQLNEAAAAKAATKPAGLVG